MNKLKSNKGHTIPIVIVIVLVLTILTSSIVYAVNVSTKKTNNEIINYTEKLVIENTTYAFINDVLDDAINLETDVYENYEYNDHTFNISLVEADTYSFVVAGESSYVLNATIKFTTDSYEILKWGFVR
jgi:flagellar basal body-associated protein FliL